MAQFLRDPVVLDADVIAIQEPWKNEFKDTTHHPAKDTHELLYPLSNGDKEQRARICMFVSKKLAGWSHIVHSQDCQELRIKGESTELRIINIYNDQNTHAALRLLPEILPRTTHPTGKLKLAGW
jgi:hypothetical protein